MYRLIDTHAHLEEIGNLGEAVAEARVAGVVAIVAVGSDVASNREVLRLAEAYPGFVYPALGWHPWNIKESETGANLEFIEANINRAVAVGEIGLDYHKKVRAVADKDLQKKVLGELLRIAGAHNKPALIHSRYAWQDALDAVAAAHLERAVFHWYTGTSSVLRGIISRGYYLSATPAAEYHEEHRRAVKEVPLERLLLETDAPVVYGRGTAAEYTSRPADVVRSLRCAAALKGLHESEIAEATTANARRLLALP